MIIYQENLVKLPKGHQVFTLTMRMFSLAETSIHCKATIYVFFVV